MFRAPTAAARPQLRHCELADLWLTHVRNAQVKTLPICRHSFHSDCLLPWLRQQGLDAFCPLCKTAVFSQTA